MGRYYGISGREDKGEEEMIFEIGDEVEAFGVRGVVVEIDMLVRVLFDERYCYFYKDGKVYSWTKEPSLKLIKKAKKKVKKYRWGIYNWHLKDCVKIRDKEKKDILIKNGYKYLEIWNNELSNKDLILKKINTIMRGGEEESRCAHNAKP